jgi:hypothetical protein
MKTYLHIATALISISFFQAFAVKQIDQINKDLFDTINSGSQGNTIFNVAFDIMRLVREGANPNAKNLSHETPLSAFIKAWIPLLQNYPENSREITQAKGIISFLLAQGADINAKSGAGTTPLMDAVNKQSLWAVQFLVDKGADVLAKTSFLGKTALDIAREIAIEKEGKKEASWWSWRTTPSIEEKDITDPIFLYLKVKVDALEVKQLEEEFEQI